MARRILGPTSGLNYRVSRFRDFETLTLYRTSREYVALNLLPRGSVQALHPMPFPDNARLQQDHQLQIYYAGWNGLLLGYPDRFVKSYCEEFHNDLAIDKKREIYKRAKSDLTKHLASINQTVTPMALGRDDPVGKEVWDIVKTFIK